MRIKPYFNSCRFTVGSGYKPPKKPFNTDMPLKTALKKWFITFLNEN
jgi:hypothetical protein